MFRHQIKDQFSIPVHHRYQVRPLSSGGAEREQPSGEPPFRFAVKGEKQEERWAIHYRPTRGGPFGLTMADG